MCCLILGERKAAAKAALYYISSSPNQEIEEETESEKGPPPHTHRNKNWIWISLGGGVTFWHLLKDLPHSGLAVLLQLVLLP